MKSFHPYRHFMLLLSVLMIGSTIVLSIILSVMIERNILKETEQVTKRAVEVHFKDLFPGVFADTKTQVNQGYYYNDRSISPETYENLKAIVSMHFNLYDILDTKFVDKQGRIYFSYDPEDIGQTLKNEETSQVFQDIMVINQTNNNRLEMWIPIHDSEGDVREIVFLNRDISEEMKAIQSMQMISVVSVFIIFTLLYISLRRVYMRSTKEIQSRNRELKKLLTSLEETYDSSLQALSAALDLRDNETKGHCLRVTAYTVHLARKMGVKADKLIHIARGALLHDIGKIGIPDHILLKPGPLNDEEWEIMKQHVVIGADMLESIDFLKHAMPIIKYHHERWDGKGYVHQLKGEEIPLEARIFALCDTYDAITSDRPYRKGKSHEEAVEEIRSCSGTQFDPKVVDVFLTISKEEWTNVKFLTQDHNKFHSLNKFIELEAGQVS
ncbi:MAG: HD domain-containing protein [Bacillaceae bacterium]|nr:HD domain-containing protein [Bacillaceae bacterium]